MRENPIFKRSDQKLQYGNTNNLRKINPGISNITRILTKQQRIQDHFGDLRPCFHYRAFIENINVLNCPKTNKNVRSDYKWELFNFK